MTDKLDYLGNSYMIIISDEWVASGEYRIEENRKRRGDDFIPDVLHFFMTNWMAKIESESDMVAERVQDFSMFLDCNVPYTHYVFNSAAEMDETWEQIKHIFHQRAILKQQLETYLNFLTNRQLKML